MNTILRVYIIVKELYIHVYGQCENNNDNYNDNSNNNEWNRMSYIEGLCINHDFYADDLCLMAPCAIALQELINMCFKYSIEIYLNFYALKLLYCVAFLPKLYKLALPMLHTNYMQIS